MVLLKLKGNVSWKLCLIYIHLTNMSKIVRMLTTEMIELMLDDNDDEMMLVTTCDPQRGYYIHRLDRY